MNKRWWVLILVIILLAIAVISLILFADFEFFSENSKGDGSGTPNTVDTAKQIEIDNLITGQMIKQGSGSG